MTYLELLNAFNIDYSIAGSHNTITTFTGLPTRLELAKRHIDRAYNEICNYRIDWTFLNYEVEFEIGPDVDSIYKETTGWDTSYLQTINENACYIRDIDTRSKLRQESWEVFRDRRGTRAYTSSSALPTRFAIDPSGRLHLYRPCDHTTIINLEVRKRGLPMVATTDEPLIPLDFQNTILYKAAVHHFDSEDAQNELAGAMRAYEDALLAMEAGCLPYGSRDALGSDETPLEMVTV